MEINKKKKIFISIVCYLIAIMLVLGACILPLNSYIDEPNLTYTISSGSETVALLLMIISALFLIIGILLNKNKISLGVFYIVSLVIVYRITNILTTSYLAELFNIPRK